MTSTFSPQVSPHVLKYISNASDLTTKLRKVMASIESCQRSRMPVPVKLSRRAETLLARVEMWRSDSSNVQKSNEECPLRFKRTHEEEPLSPTGSRASSSSLSPPKTGASPYKKKQSVVSLDRVLKNRYQKTWKKTKENQGKLISSFRWIWLRIFNVGTLLKVYIQPLSFMHFFSQSLLLQQVQKEWQ